MGTCRRCTPQPKPKPKPNPTPLCPSHTKVRNSYSPYAYCSLDIIQRWPSPQVSHRQVTAVRSFGKRGDAAAMTCPKAAEPRPQFQQRRRSRHHVCVHSPCLCPPALKGKVWGAISNAYRAHIYPRVTGIWSSPQTSVHCLTCCTAAYLRRGPNVALSSPQPAAIECVLACLGQLFPLPRCRLCVSMQIPAPISSTKRQTQRLRGTARVCTSRASALLP